MDNQEKKKIMERIEEQFYNEDLDPWTDVLISFSDITSLSDKEIAKIILSMGLQYESLGGGNFWVSFPELFPIEVTGEAFRIQQNFLVLYQNGTWNEDGEKSSFIYTELSPEEIKYSINEAGIPCSVKQDKDNKFKKYVTIYKR
jgi:hypothetical protein